ncbi:MAG: 3,4-dihydroxy-2-butanone-4-phosphate synthase [Halobacteriaceae archaeon]
MSLGDSVPRAVADAVAAFRAGDPVLVHDFSDREGEVDLVVPPRAVGPADVARLRNDAGGLICVALGDAAADAFDLPFLADELDHPAAEASHLGYDERSSFSLPVNHRDTYTGVTDEDRATTISALGDAAADPEGTDFAAEFRAPGHVHVLRAAPGLLAERRGHTELGVALARAADCPPAAVVCEMLADDGQALTVAAARDYAERHGFAFVEGADLVEALA